MCSLCTDVVDFVNNTNLPSREQHRFMEMIKTSVRNLENNHYKITLPLRNGNLRLPVTKSLAEQRACYLKRKFFKNPTFFEQYKQFIEEMIDQGHAEKIEVLEGEEGKTWYIPHNGVYHNNKPSKLRVVFDCSARYKGTCLNDHLLPGPDITNSLIGVLLRFRRVLIGFQGNIKDMFYQVQAPPTIGTFYVFCGRKIALWKMTYNLIECVSISSELFLHRAAQTLLSNKRLWTMKKSVVLLQSTL